NGAALQAGQLVVDRQAPGVGQRAEQGEGDGDHQHRGGDVGALQRLHPVAGTQGRQGVAGGMDGAHGGAGHGDNPVRGQAVLADAQGQAPGGDADQRHQQHRGDAHGPAQGQRRQVLRLAVLIGGVDQQDQGAGGGQHQGGGAAGAPQAVEARERQGGEEAEGQHRHHRQQPRQQHQGDQANAADQAVAHVGQVHGQGEDDAGHRNPEPVVTDQILEEGQADDPEQGRAEEQDDPEHAGEAQRQGQLHPSLPGGVEIGGVRRQQSPGAVGRGDQVVRDEQGRGADEQQKRRRERQFALARGLLTDVIPAEEGQHGGGGDAPDQQGAAAQAPDPRQQQDGDEGGDQQQGREGQRVRARPSRAISGPVQGEQRQALDEADGQPDQAEAAGRGRGFRRGIVDDVGHWLGPPAPI